VEHLVATLLRVHEHGAELDDHEGRAVPAAAGLPVERRARAVEPDRDGDRQEQGRQQQEHRPRHEDVEAALHHPGAAPEAGARERHDGRAGQVLERRVGREELVVARDDRDLQVRLPHAAGQLEHLLVRGARRGQDHAVGLEAGHGVHQVGR
jgi:hypothetical protein